MARERTYIMLKPDALERGLIGEILSRIERKGYRIEQMKMITLDEPSCVSIMHTLWISRFSRTRLPI